MYLSAQDIARGNFFIGINPEFLLNDFCILYIVAFFIRYSPGQNNRIEIVVRSQKFELIALFKTIPHLCYKITFVVRSLENERRRLFYGVGQQYGGYSSVYHDDFGAARAATAAYAGKRPPRYRGSWGPPCWTSPSARPAGPGSRPHCGTPGLVPRPQRVSVARVQHGVRLPAGAASCSNATPAINCAVLRHRHHCHRCACNTAAAMACACQRTS